MIETTWTAERNARLYAALTGWRVIAPGEQVHICDLDHWDAVNSKGEVSQVPDLSHWHSTETVLAMMAAKGWRYELRGGEGWKFRGRFIKDYFSGEDYPYEASSLSLAVCMAAEWALKPDQEVQDA